MPLCFSHPTAQAGLQAPARRLRPAHIHKSPSRSVPRNRSRATTSAGPSARANACGSTCCSIAVCDAAMPCVTAANMSVTGSAASRPKRPGRRSHRWRTQSSSNLSAKPISLLTAKKQGSRRIRAAEGRRSGLNQKKIQALAALLPRGKNKEIFAGYQAMRRRIRALPVPIGVHLASALPEPEFCCGRRPKAGRPPLLLAVNIRR